MTTPGTGTAPPGGAPGARPGAGTAGALAPARTELLGCPFDPIDMAGAVGRAVGWCEGDRRPRTIVTINAALVVAMRSDPDLARACRAGDLVLADGVPVVWASRLAGARLPARVAG
ncbi:MAG TPA: hypothetical protein VFK90_15065, partial [Anaeromyxobacter sp.]|nr:hypothetical protein [Anaeromyxobacter sp.]